MQNNLPHTYLLNIQQLFYYYKSLGDKAIEQVSEKKINWVKNENSNSLAQMVKHLSGNMISRWTDFLITDGEKAWRNRDSEFEGEVATKNELLTIWDNGWHCLFNTLNNLKPEDLNKTIYIRTQPHTVMEAINRQLAHYSYHVGQIVFLAKELDDGEWNSLSIPKNKSKEFNELKFGNKKQH